VLAAHGNGALVLAGWLRGECEGPGRAEGRAEGRGTTHQPSWLRGECEGPGRADCRRTMRDADGSRPRRSRGRGARRVCWCARERTPRCVSRQRTTARSRCSICPSDVRRRSWHALRQRTTAWSRKAGDEPPPYISVVERRVLAPHGNGALLLGGWLRGECDGPGRTEGRCTTQEPRGSRPRRSRGRGARRVCRCARERAPRCVSRQRAPPRSRCSICPSDVRRRSWHALRQRTTAWSRCSHLPSDLPGAFAGT
jgi:hypothetical protein